MQGWLSKGRSEGDVVIAPEGWQEITRLQQANVGSRVGFVAMRFTGEFQPLFNQGIEPGIRAAGYESFRVDRKEHNNRIDDEIIASIKQSRFLIADFAECRGGIYFEAGFAMGLGLPVIWLTRADQLDNVHFDNRQYNFITWCDGEWDELIKRLRFRIEATIGRGPLARWMIHESEGDLGDAHWPLGVFDAVELIDIDDGQELVAAAAGGERSPFTRSHSARCSSRKRSAALS